MRVGQLRMRKATLLRNVFWVRQRPGSKEATHRVDYLDWKCVTIFWWYLPNLFTWSVLLVPKYRQFHPACPDSSLTGAQNSYCSSTIRSTNSAFQLGADGSLVSHREPNFGLFCRNLISRILEPDCQGNTDLCYPFDCVNQKIGRFDSGVGKLGDVSTKCCNFMTVGKSSGTCRFRAFVTLFLQSGHSKNNRFWEKLGIDFCWASIAMRCCLVCAKIWETFLKIQYIAN